MQNQQFIVLLDNFKSISELEDAALLVHRAMSEVISVDGREVYLEPYVGIAHYPQDGPVHTLLQLRHAGRQHEAARSR